MMKLLRTLIIVTIILYSTSCEDFLENRRPENEYTESSFNEDESHEYGKNCMDCHYSAGFGEGWFSLAGSIGGANSKARVELYNDTTLNPVYKIEVDRKGNFYTTSSINYTNGIFVGVRNNNDSVRYMKSKIFFGQCNLCHGKIEKTLNINW